jgi:hypothetical protein
MSTIRIWALESDHDAKAVECLANKLKSYLQLGDLRIESSGASTLSEIQARVRKSLPRRARRNVTSDAPLKRATHDYLKDEACVIFVIDQDSPKSLNQRRQEPNSLINQIEAVINEPSLDGKVFLALAVQELEAWLLIDCLGILCSFASSETGALKENEGDKTSTNPSFAQLADNFQEDNTEDIVKEEIEGSDPKEYLIKYSEAILRKLNPDIRQMDIYRRRYRPAMTPAMANYVDVNEQTLRRNTSLRYLGELLTRFN